MESIDNNTWSTLININPIPTTGTNLIYPVNNASKYLKFIYNKSTGNVAFDDFKLTKNNATSSSSTGNMAIYFNHAVDNSVSTGVNAVYLNGTIDDTLIAYINRAKYTIDIALYNFIQTTAISDIATAINNAYARGVAVRWIYNGSSSNTGLSLINSAINKLGSPTGANYNIMHNKFMIIDANSSNAKDPIVWTGSTNWDDQQINTDANNVIIIQDKNLSLAYTTEFNEMWGGTGLSPNLANSKFGPYKLDNTPHTFTINGNLVELYFSPSDSTENQIKRVISSANFDLYFGIYTFTENYLADSIKIKQQNGVYTLGIMDQYSTTFAPYATLSPIMGADLKVYSSPGIYHNKMLIVDPCHLTSDPTVVTGSHNWTYSADTKNDENTLIIHDDTVANIYYQSFVQNFTDLSGTFISQCNPIITNVTLTENKTKLFFYPNPATDELYINHLPLSSKVNYQIYDNLGQEINSGIINNGSINISKLKQGVYFIYIQYSHNESFRGKFFKQ